MLHEPLEPLHRFRVALGPRVRLADPSERERFRERVIVIGGKKVIHGRSVHTFARRAQRISTSRNDQRGRIFMPLPKGIRSST